MRTAEEQADLYAKLGDQHRVAGHYDEAIEYYQRSAELLKESNLPIDYNWVMLSLIQTQLFLERIDHAQHSLELLDRTVDLSILFRVDLSLAESAVHVAMDRQENAFRQAEYTETLINELGSEDAAMRIERLLDLSIIYEVLAQYQSAAYVLRSAKSIAERLEEPPLAEIALIDLKIGINDAPNTSNESVSLSIQRMERSIDMLMESGERFHAAWGLRQLGNMHLRTAQFDRAAQVYSTSRAQMVQILGEDHHESALCRAYELIALHAHGDRSGNLQNEFTNTLEKLSQTLGENHFMIRSLQSDWDTLYLWKTSSP